MLFLVDYFLQMDNMRQEHQKEKDSLAQNISDVEAQLQQANVKVIANIFIFASYRPEER